MVILAAGVAVDSPSHVLSDNFYWCFADRILFQPYGCIPCSPGRALPETSPGSGCTSCNTYRQSDLLCSLEKETFDGGKQSMLTLKNIHKTYQTSKNTALPRAEWHLLQLCPGYQLCSDRPFRFWKKHTAQGDCWTDISGHR